MPRDATPRRATATSGRRPPGAGELRISVNLHAWELAPRARGRKSFWILLNA